MSEKQWEKVGDVFFWAHLPLHERPDPHMRRLGREQCLHAPLFDFLCSTGVDQNLTGLLDCVDWRSLYRGYSGAPGNVGLHAIASIPGEHIGSRYGMKRLGDILRMLPKFPPSPESPVLLQVWSIGGSAAKWYKIFIAHLTQEFRQDKRIDESPRLPDTAARFVVQSSGSGHCRSFDGRMVTRECLWEDPRHPLFHDSETNVAWGWHSKVMFRLYPAGMCQRQGCGRAHGWAYVGSHNCSAAFWGSIYRDGHAKTCIINFEFGIVISSLPAMRRGAGCGFDLCKEAVPIPWSNISNLVPFIPNPEFIFRSVVGVLPFMVVVSSVSSDHSDVTVVTTKPLISREDAISDDDKKKKKKKEEEEEEESKEESDSFKELRITLSSNTAQEDWLPQVGTELLLDISATYGIVHIY